MSKLHELLAVEKSTTSAATKLLNETKQKFGKFEYFQGNIKTLKMLEDNIQNKALEDAAAQARTLPTTVQETLEYTLKFWAQAEDVILQKNITNQRAVADIVIGDSVLAKDVPVDELLGLETRLETLRQVMDGMPTLPASVSCSPDTTSGRKGSWKADVPEVTTKTEKVMVPVVLYEATKEHPAQVKEVASDKVVGRFTNIALYGAATSAQKAEVIERIDALAVAVKQARMRANSVDADKSTIGNKITSFILDPFNK